MATSTLHADSMVSAQQVEEDEDPPASAKKRRKSIVSVDSEHLSRYGCHKRAQHNGPELWILRPDTAADRAEFRNVCSCF